MLRMSPSLNDVKSTLQSLHDDKTMLAMRFGAVVGNQVNKTSGGCFYGITGYLSSSAQHPYIYAAFHGDGAEMSFDALRNNSVFNQKMIAHQIPWNQFTGTARSKRWVEYLLSETSPWAALHPYMPEKDPDYINNAGFIFTGDGLPHKLAYNFVMAIRYPWEMTRNYELMLRLIDDAKLEPNVACFISMNYTLSDKAKDLDGPYDVIYPWSFLENTNLEAAGRFILGRPGTLSSTEPSTNPNVVPLWSMTKADVVSHATKIYNAFCDDTNLTLGKIVSGINECVELQRKEIA